MPAAIQPGHSLAGGSARCRWRHAARRCVSNDRHEVRRTAGRRPPAHGSVTFCQLKSCVLMGLSSLRASSGAESGLACAAARPAHSSKAAATTAARARAGTARTRCRGPAGRRSPCKKCVSARCGGACGMGWNTCAQHGERHGSPGRARRPLAASTGSPHPRGRLRHRAKMSRSRPTAASSLSLTARGAHVGISSVSGVSGEAARDSKLKKHMDVCDCCTPASVVRLARRSLRPERQLRPGAHLATINHHTPSSLAAVAPAAPLLRQSMHLMVTTGAGRRRRQSPGIEAGRCQSAGMG